MSTKKRDHHHADHMPHVVTRQGPTEKPAPVIKQVSDDERSPLIQIRAYSLWEQAGKPEGDAARERLWFDAEKEITSSYGREA